MDPTYDFGGGVFSHVGSKDPIPTTSPNDPDSRTEVLPCPLCAEHWRKNMDEAPSRFSVVTPAHPECKIGVPFGVRRAPWSS